MKSFQDRKLDEGVRSLIVCFGIALSILQRLLTPYASALHTAYPAFRGLHEVWTGELCKGRSEKQNEVWNFLDVAERMNVGGGEGGS